MTREQALIEFIREEATKFENQARACLDRAPIDFDSPKYERLAAAASALKETARRGELGIHLMGRYINEDERQE